MSSSLPVHLSVLWFFSAAEVEISLKFSGSDLEILVSIWSFHSENGGLEDGSLLVMVVTCFCTEISVR